MILQANFLLSTLQKIYPGCSNHSATELVTHFKAEKFKRGTPVLQQGDIWNQVLLIESGIIRMHFLRSDGKEFNKNFFPENSMLCPLTPAMWSAPSLFAITAIENTTIWCCSIEVFIKTLQGTEWQTIRGELLSRLLDSKLQREHDLLALNGRQRYDKFLNNQAHLAERVPLLHLATYLGMTDVSLSRLRNKKSN